MTLTNYWWLLIWLFAGGIFLSVFFQKQEEIVLGKREVRWHPLAAFLLILPYICWATFRSDVTVGDTASYRAAFKLMPTEISGWSEFLADVTKDKGFSVFSLFIKLIVGNSSVLYFLIIALIQILILAMIYRKYSCDYWMSIFLFIATTDYMSWVNNGIRQFLAVTLILSTLGFLLKKKYLIPILVILLASTFHGSALIMLPIIFIIQGKAWNKRTLLFAAASVVVLLFVDRFTNVLDTLLVDTQYSNMATDWQTWNDDGTNPLRVLVYSIPTILSLIGLKYIKAEDDPVINLTTNASIVSTALYLISMGTSGMFIGRLPVYVSTMALGILFPWEIKHMFTEDSARIVKFVTVCCFTIFFYYQMHAWGIL